MSGLKILKKQNLYKGRVFDLVKEHIYFEGRVINAEIIKHPGAVVIIPILKNGNLVFVKQFRAAIKDYILEFPAGTLKKDESLVKAVKRELKEETGFTAKGIREILKVFPSPGYSTEAMHIFIASGLKPGKAKLEKDEVLSIKILNPKRALEMIKKGLIKDSKTIIGILAFYFLIEKTNF